MQRLCIDSSCSYLGRSVSRAVLRNSAFISNGAGDETEVSRRHSSWRSQDVTEDEGLNVNQGGAYPVSGTAQHVLNVKLSSGGRN